MAKEPLTIEGLRGIKDAVDMMVKVLEFAGANMETKAKLQALGKMYSSQEQWDQILNSMPAERAVILMRALLTLASLKPMDFNKFVMGPHKKENMTKLKEVQGGLHAALDDWPKPDTESKAGRPPYG